MRGCTWLLVGVIVAGLCGGGCRKRMTQEVITPQNSQQILQRIQQFIELSPGDALLVAAYLVRYEAGDRTGPNAATLPATVGTMIARQRAFATRRATAPGQMQQRFRLQRGL